MNRNITGLGLNENYIGNTGAKYLSEVIKVNKSILGIDLKYNQIRDIGFKSIVKGKKDNNITTIYLEGNDNEYEYDIIKNIE